MKENLAVFYIKTKKSLGGFQSPIFTFSDLLNFTLARMLYLFFAYERFRLSCAGWNMEYSPFYHVWVGEFASLNRVDVPDPHPNRE